MRECELGSGCGFNQVGVSWGGVRVKCVSVSWGQGVGLTGLGLG